MYKNPEQIRKYEWVKRKSLNYIKKKNYKMFKSS